MNQHVKPLCASSITSEEKDYVLSILRVVSARLRLIEAEANSVGVARSRGLITPSALLGVETVAPGCYDAVALAVLMRRAPTERLESESPDEQVGSAKTAIGERDHRAEGSARPVESAGL